MANSLALDSSLRALGSLLWEALPTLLVVLGLLGCGVAILLLAFPKPYQQLAARVNRWIPTHRWQRPLDRPISIERWFYRHHRLLGGLLAAGATFVLTSWWWQVGGWAGHQAALRQILTLDSGLIADILATSLALLLLGGNLLALVFGLLVIIRPSLLRPLERWSNQWVHSNRWLYQLDRPRLNDEALYLEHRILIGILILLGGAYMLSNGLALLFLA